MRTVRDGAEAAAGWLEAKDHAGLPEVPAPRPSGEQVSTPKLLVVTSWFPATGGGRIDKLVKLLPRFGVTPVVLAPRATFSARSRQLLTQYPSDLQVHYVTSIGWSYFADRFLDRTPQAPKYTLLSVLSFPERFLYVPDHMIRWIMLGKRRASRLVVEQGLQAVLTSSPPESTHLIGLALKQRFGIPWIADFRDLWTARRLLYRPATPLHDRWNRRLERRILQQADHILANTDENRDYYVRDFGVPPDRITVVPNGFDPDDVPEPQPPDTAHEVFRIGYMGNLSKHDLPWRPFLSALRRLADEVGHERLAFVHCGFASAEVVECVSRLGLQRLFTSHGWLLHRQAMEIIGAAHLRLALLGDNGHSGYMVPAKLYEYLPMGGPILAVAPAAGAVARVLAETGAGSIAWPVDDVEGIYRRLRDFFRKWERQERLVDPNWTQIGRYNRQRHAAQVAQVVNTLLARGSIGSPSTRPE